MNPGGYKEYVALKERAFKKTLAAQEEAQGVSNGKAKTMLGFRPRPLEWLGR